MQTMMSRQKTSQQHSPLLFSKDREVELITTLHEAMIRNGVTIRQEEITNFYISIKSKPLAILAGPKQYGKIALVQNMALSLCECESLRTQMIVGHPWWAEGCEDIASHTQIHTRFSTEKILAIIEEANLPGNSFRVFIACLTHISPAELLSFFTEVAFQIQNGRIMRLGDAHLSQPIPFPSNLRIIGTMDTQEYDWWDADLLLNTTVIQWPQATVRPSPMLNRGYRLDEYEFLQSCVRSRESAYQKLIPIFKNLEHPLYPLLKVETILKKYISISLDRVRDEIMIYLANSWSASGNGLFNLSPQYNLTAALDTAFTQILLPRAVEALRNLEPLRSQLKSMFTVQYPRSAAFVSEFIN